MAIIKSENWDSVTAPALPSGWTAGSTNITWTTTSVSAPNGLTSSNNGSNEFITCDTPDAMGGNAQASSDCVFNTPGVQAQAYVACRVKVASTSIGSMSSYIVVLDKSSKALNLNKYLAGSGTGLGSVTAASITAGEVYRLYLSCVGKTICVRLQRISDNSWLDSSGNWQPSFRTAIQVTDGSLTGVGKAALATFRSNTATDQATMDNFLFEDIPAPLPCHSEVPSQPSLPVHLLAALAFVPLIAAPTLTPLPSVTAPQPQVAQHRVALQPVGQYPFPCPVLVSPSGGGGNTSRSSMRAGRWQYQSSAQPAFVPAAAAITPLPSVTAYQPSRLSQYNDRGLFAFVPLVSPPAATPVPSVTPYQPSRTSAYPQLGYFALQGPVSSAPSLPLMPLVSEYQPLITHPVFPDGFVSFIDIAPAAPPTPPAPQPIRPAAFTIPRNFGGFAFINSAVVASPLGQPTLAYVARGDADQIAIVDTVTPAPVDFAVYYAHSFTGETPHRDMRKKIARVYVYGEGNISGVFGSAYMVITADQNRSDVYPYSDLSPWPPEQMLWRQNTLNMYGHVFDICLFITGTGVVIREIQLEYTVV